MKTYHSVVLIVELVSVHRSDHFLGCSKNVSDCLWKKSMILGLSCQVHEKAFLLWKKKGHKIFILE
jgi:hypothetical protein